MARSSVFRYKGRDVDPQTVAKELKVEAVVTGRIVQHGDQLIISSELIDARTSRNLWGDQYDRKVSDALAVQQEITGAISARLRERLSGETRKQVAKGGTNDPEAYQLYLKGLYYWEKRTPETLDKAQATTSTRPLTEILATPSPMSGWPTITSLRRTTVPYRRA